MIIEEWGGPLSSIISIEEDGQCINVIYENTVVSSPYNSTWWEYLIDGHTIRIDEASGNFDDLLTVVPAAGWELVTNSPMVAPDWATTIITFCQYLLG